MINFKVAGQTYALLDLFDNIRDEVFILPLGPLDHLHIDCFAEKK